MTDKSATETQSRDDNGLIEELNQLGFCATLTALKPAIAATRFVTYGAGDVIFHEATEIESLYVVRQGRIKLLNYMENGRARIVRVHNKGSVIGLNALMDEPHTHTAIAIDDVEVYQLPMHLLKNVKNEDAEAYCQLLEYWHDYLNRADTWITEFSTGAIKGRVARLIRFLLELEDSEDDYEVTLLTVEEMADILGVTPESVSRIMAEFKRKKYLQATDDETPNRFRCSLKAIHTVAET